jgi:hypothetical protein
MSDKTTWPAALRRVADRWRDPEYEPRAVAVEQTLAADNRFTEESIAFDVNHASDLAAGGDIQEWLGEVDASGARLAIIAGGGTPMDGFLEAVAAGLAGCEVLVQPDASSPDLLAAFIAEVAAEAGDLRVAAASGGEVLEGADALLAHGSVHDRELWAVAAERQGLSADRIYFRQDLPGVAVLAGDESRADLSGLAEDVLLHEGGTLRSVRMVLAPDDLAPDDLLESMAGFREVFPPHSDTEGAFKMTAAFLEAAGRPHAVGPGFLVSKGEAEPQSGAHLRWVGTESFEAALEWIGEHAAEVGFVASSARLADTLRQRGWGVPVLSFGDAHRPAPGQPPLTDAVRALLARLAR